MLYCQTSLIPCFEEEDRESSRRGATGEKSEFITFSPLRLNVEVNTRPNVAFTVCRDHVTQTFTNTEVKEVTFGM